MAGTVAGLNTPGAMRYDLRLAWRLADASAWASRFMPLPGHFLWLDLGKPDALVIPLFVRLADPISARSPNT